MLTSMEGLASCFSTTTGTTTATAITTDHHHHHNHHHHHHHLYQMEERENSSDNSGDNSPSSTAFASSISSPKRSRRAIQKKVVTVDIKNVEGSRFKGDCTPPSDSWAWRKYGQKPIKGSPYPRGYYRCSSSKGCPARKQVERSRADPSKLVITYSYEHNHAWPTSRNRHNSSSSSSATPTTTTTTSTSTTPTTTTTTPTGAIPTTIPKLEINNNHHHLGGHDQPLMIPTDELTWLTSDSNTSSFFSSCGFGDLANMAKIFPLGEEEEALFADLGELPECSVVFGQPPTGRREKDQQQQQQQEQQQQQDECNFNW